MGLVEMLKEVEELQRRMAEQLEDDASLVASDAEQAAIKAETENQNIIQEAQNLGVDIERER